MHSTCLIHLILLDWKCINYEAPHYALHNLLHHSITSSPLRANIFLRTIPQNTLSLGLQYFLNVNSKFHTDITEHKNIFRQHSERQTLRTE
jgi:hypothetical protein